MKKLYYLIYFSLITCFYACKKEQAIAVKTEFDYSIVENNYTVPVKVNFTNNSYGAEHYKWTFEGGVPETSSLKAPGTITFSSAGEHTITLEAWNEDERNIKTVTLQLDSAVSINFDAKILVNNFSPVKVEITNTTLGATSFNWTFDGGEPASSIANQPGLVTFTSPGEHLITLVASNGRSNFTLTKKIKVESPLNPNFEIIPSFDDEDYQAPLTATLKNNTVSSLTQRWSALGGKIANDTARTTSIYFDKPGTYEITLTANNNKETKVSSKSITVLPNTNLRTHSNIKLGISSAQNMIGSFYSTVLRKSFTSSDNLKIVGKDIDIIYFGLNQNFNYNRFISPDSAGVYAFDPIPLAQSVKIINSVEYSSSNLSVADFDAMLTDDLLKQQQVNYSAANWKQFSSSIAPRIILFQTKDGRKGAIKIKEFVKNGAQSYVLLDIKVQKEPA